MLSTLLHVRAPTAALAPACRGRSAIGRGDVPVQLDAELPDQPLSLDQRLARTDASIAELNLAADHAWLYVTSFLIFFMQAGFALLEAGAVGSKDIISILLKNFSDFFISSLMYWMVGMGFHYGDTPFIGASTSDTKYFATDDVLLMPRLLQSTMFCATAVTIVSGAIACRFSVHAGSAGHGQGCVYVRRARAQALVFEFEFELSL